MVSLPCFADCANAKDGECLLNVIGGDRLSEFECACEFYKKRDVSRKSPVSPVSSDI